MFLGTDDIKLGVKYNEMSSVKDMRFFFLSQSKFCQRQSCEFLWGTILLHPCLHGEKKYMCSWKTSLMMNIEKITMSPPPRKKKSIFGAINFALSLSTSNRQWKMIYFFISTLRIKCKKKTWRTSKPGQFCFY